MTTQICAECGTRAEPGQSFCNSCGAVLRWDPAGARTGSPAPAASEADSGPDAFPRPAAGTAQPSRRAQDAGPHWTPASGARPDAYGPGQAPTSAPAPAGTDVPPAPSGPPLPHASGAVPPPSVERDTAEAPQAYRAAADDSGSEDTDPHIPMPPAPDDVPPGDPLSDRARSLVVPVADPEAAPTAPAPAAAPVLPGRPDTERPQVRAPERSRDGYGPPCRWCATPNHPSRHFCNHCAMPLAESAVRTPGHQPWWRRLFGPGRRDTPWAGERPRLRRVFDSIGTWITCAVALTLLILAVVYVPDGIQATRDHFAKRAPAEPDGIRASRSYSGHGPKRAIDKLNNTWWGPGVSQTGHGEWIEVSFTRPTRLLDLIITPGVSTRADQLSKSALPHRVKATITKKDGGTTTRELTLDPAAGGQRRDFDVGEVTRVRFTIESAHAASADKQVAIAEIELFGPSDGDQV